MPKAFGMWNVKKNYNDETNLYAYKFDSEILKPESKITKIWRTIKEVVSYLQKASFFL